MVLDAFKKYPSQISSAFRRFPVASALAFFTFFALVYSTEHTEIFERLAGMRFLAWLGIYPIAAMLISLTTSLVQESLKNESKLPQAISGAAWLALSIILAFGITSSVAMQFSLLAHYSTLTYYFIASTALVYVTATLSIFIAPFWKDKDENAFWIFLFKNLKALVVAALVTALLLASVEALVFCFGALFEHDFDEKVYFYIFYFCASAVFPILYFSGIPAIEECHRETPALNKFATSTIRFLFVPVLSLAILLFYAYIVKFIVLWDMPQGMVSYFVSGFMIYMLALVTILYPTRLAPGNTFEKKLLKVFPAACIPLVVMMSVGLIRRISDYGISAERIYAATINIYFYIIIAVFLIDKIKCKSRYIAVIFCAIFFVITDTPLSAYSISQRVWMGSIREALAEAGYTEFPLSKEDARKFVIDLRKKDDKKSKLVASRMLELAEAHNPEFTEYLLITGYDYAFTKDLAEDECCEDSDSTDAEPFDQFEVSIEYPEKAVLQVPRGTKGAVAIDHYFNNDEFEFTGDTLTFRISLKEDSGCSCNSDESDACPDSTAGPAGESATRTVYSFTVDRQALKQDSTRQIKTDGAAIAISYLHAEEESKSSKSLRIKGILFVE
ncbi:DUF4153 domain-containing protein [Fibrobacter sp. UWR2]|uniref:DUF4153 domain-containing protein n=1 Tax=Fibrobacter sp. UWR2 TaxID=1964352 RepID=UPI000B525574|nr:DUF4153 domain-containing protein [Fibrobacter sp. UWR2]OWU98636.1 hypothetical protein B7994_13120 [Fibrobacter sp. UWR2]